MKVKKVSVDDNAPSIKTRPRETYGTSTKLCRRVISANLDCIPAQ